MVLVVCRLKRRVLLVTGFEVVAFLCLQKRVMFDVVAARKDTIPFNPITTRSLKIFEEPLCVLLWKPKGKIFLLRSYYCILSG